MKTRRIVSLFIAVLMILTALPLTFVTAVADEVPASVGVTDALAGAPATLPNGDTYTTAPLFLEDTVFSATTNNLKWVQPTAPDALASTNHKGLNEGVGIMFKVDASGIPAGDDAFTLYGGIRAFAEMNGENKDIVLMFNAGAIGWLHGSTQNNPEGFVSTWYYSIDGTTWDAISSTVAQFPTVAHREVIYFYIPYSSMIFSYGESFFTTGKGVKGEQGLSFAEATEIVGYWTEPTKTVPEGIQFEIANNAMGSALLRDICFVYKHEAEETPAMFERESITLTDDLSYHLYATIPAGAEGRMTFTFAGNTVEAVGILQGDGTTKYTLNGILPGQMGEEIVATWTGTAAGEAVAYTYKTSVESYARELFGEPSHIGWHDMVKALLHYGAAVQSYDAEPGAKVTLVNRGIGAVALPVNMSRMPTVYQNGNSAIWKSAALRPNGALHLKVGVSAPAGVTQVQYTVEGKTKVVDIVDGFAYIPVSAHQFMDEITLVCYDGAQATGETLKISAFYCLANENTAGNAKYATLISAIANYAAEARSQKGNDAPNNVTTTLAQMALASSDAPGMSYVIQLADGRFVIIDGGVYSEDNTNTLWNYLYEKSNYTKPVVAAWIFTHVDGDHTQNAFKFLTIFRNKIDLQTIAYTLNDDYKILFAPREDDVENNPHRASAIYAQDTAIAALAQIKGYHPNSTVWEMTAGESVTFGDVKVDVLVDATQVYATNPTVQNQLSAILKFTFTQGTASTEDDKTFMVLGDSTAARLTKLEEKGAAVLKSDVLQATHHGLSGGRRNTYQMIAPTISFVPICEQDLRDKGYYNQEFNWWIFNNSVEYFHDTTTVIDMSTLTVVN